MSEPRFGNRRTSKKNPIENEMLSGTEEAHFEEEKSALAFEASNEILSFMEESQKKKKVIPMRQVIFRLPVDKFEKVENAIGSMSIQQFYSNLTDFYLSKSEKSNN